MNEAKEQNLFQSFFQSQLTWIGMIVMAVWGAIVTIVLPVNTMQVQLAQIQVQLKAQNIAYTALTAQIDTISTKQQVDEQVMSNFNSEISRIFPSIITK